MLMYIMHTKVILLFVSNNMNMNDLIIIIYMSYLFHALQTLLNFWAQSASHWCEAEADCAFESVIRSHSQSHSQSRHT